MRRHEIRNMEDALVYYRQQQAKAMEQYEVTGRRRFANDEFLNGLLVTALEKALDKKDAVDRAREKRSQEIYAYIETKLDKMMYTRDEVARILKQMSWW